MRSTERVRIWLILTQDRFGESLFKFRVNPWYVARGTWFVNGGSRRGGQNHALAW